MIQHVMRVLLLLIVAPTFAQPAQPAPVPITPHNVTRLTRQVGSVPGRFLGFTAQDGRQFATHRWRSVMFWQRLGDATFVPQRTIFPKADPGNRPQAYSLAADGHQVAFTTFQYAEDQIRIGDAALHVIDVPRAQQTMVYRSETYDDIAGSAITAISSSSSPLLLMTNWDQILVWQGSAWIQPPRAFPSEGTTMHQDVILAIAISSDAQRIASASPNGRGYYAAPDGRYISYFLSEATIILWDVPTATPLGSIAVTGMVPARRALAFSPDGRALALGGWGDSRRYGLRLYDVASQTELWRASQNGVTSVAFNHAGTLLASTTGAGSIHVHDVASGTLLLIMPVTQRGSVDHVAFSPDDRWLAVTVTNPSDSPNPFQVNTVFYAVSTGDN